MHRADDMEAIELTRTTGAVLVLIIRRYHRTKFRPRSKWDAKRYFAVEARFSFALRDHLALRVSLMIHHCLFGYSGEPCVSAVFGVCGFDFAPAHSKCIGSR